MLCSVPRVECWVADQSFYDSYSLEPPKNGIAESKRLRTSMHIFINVVIAQAISRRLPTAAARVRAQVRLCGIYGEQSGMGARFLRVLRFLLPIRIPPIASQSSSLSSSSEVSTIGQTVAAVPSGLSLTTWEIIYLYAESTARRPITKRAQCRYK
jgi:hypothetical protein